MTDYRQAFLDEIEFLTSRRAAILDMIREEPEGEIFWGLLLRMTEADITRNRKGIDSIDGKTSHLEFMRWYREHLFLKQVRLAELRGIVESSRDNGCFDTPIGRSLHEAALQAVRDDLLQETHHREQLDAAMEEVDAMHPVSDPDTAGVKKNAKK